MLFCENQGSEAVDGAGSNSFTPCASSLIVLNAVMQNQTVFKDIRSFLKLKDLCKQLSQRQELGPPQPAAESDVRLNSTAPPKCWIFSMAEQDDANNNIEEATRDDLTDFAVDPLDNLIGFFSVVGTKPALPPDGSLSAMSSGVANPQRSSGVASALCKRSSDLKPSASTVKKSTAKKPNNH